MGYILLLDDDEAIPELLSMLLTEEGYEVQSASTAKQALEMAQSRQPDLILFDMKLPDQDGEAFVKAYKELPGGTAPLIALSAMAHLEEEADRIGADGWIAKPFDLEQLLLVVADCLKRQE